MELLDLYGPTFLGVFLLLAVVAAWLAHALWRALTGPDELDHRLVESLTPIEVAYLAGGPS